MNIVCVICSDLLQPSDDIFYTPCGHIFHFACVTQWLERSRTCPQCRDKVTQTKIHRIYFNFSNNDTIVEDATSLQASVDSMKFQVMVKEREIKQSNEKIDSLKKMVVGLREEYGKLEAQLSERTTAIYAFKEQLKYFKELSSDSENAKKEVARLKKKLDDCRSIQTLMNAAAEDVDEMIRNMQDPNTLITYISVMKRELSTSVVRRKELRTTVRKLQQDLSAVSMERNMLLDIRDQKKQLEEELAIARSRVMEKTERIKELEEMLPSSQRGKNAAGRKVNAAEITKDKSNTAKETNDEENAKSLDNPWSIIDLTDESMIGRRKRSATSLSTDNDVVDRPPERLRGNDENSPYLSYKSSHGLGTDILKKKVKITSGPSSHSILAKKPRLGQSAHSLQETHRTDLTYDGFGGHSKTDKFPSPKKSIGEAKKSNRGPSRKVKLDDGNNKKLRDFVNN